MSYEGLLFCCAAWGGSLAEIALSGADAVSRWVSGPHPPRFGAWGTAAILPGGAVVDWFSRRRSRAEPSASAAGPALPRALAGGAADPAVLARACELVRRATDAHEAAMWTVDDDGVQARRVGLAALPDHANEVERVELAGHPFGWAVHEQAHVHLERGRKPLPTPWAAEMLLIPLPSSRALLSLAYAQHVPPGAEAAAVDAGTHLGEVLALLRVQQHAGEDQQQMTALLEAVRELPQELQTDRFAERLADAVMASTNAEGALVAAWQAEHGTGEVLAVRGAGPHDDLCAGTRVAEGESRLAMAAKHGVHLDYPDLQRERDRLPLCVAAEQWIVRPGSATILPLAANGRVVGALVAWHPQPEHFGERRQELLRLLAMVAPNGLQNARRYEALDRRASTDALTGLPNRHTFDARLAAIATYYERYARPFGILILDVDFFKKFNDTWGHEAGDRVLQHVAQLVRSTVREVDLPARMGGEEFVVLMPETRLKEVLEVAERLREAIETHPVIWNGRPLPVTASLGAAACPDCGDDPDRLLAAADAALYEAKAGGRNRVCAARSTVSPRP